MKTNPNFVMNRFSDVNVLVDVTGQLNGVVKLSDTSADVWEALSQGKTVEDAAKVLCDKYEVTYEKALKDTREFCEKMLEQGFLEK
ncbi:MAG: PqqD family protein [Oscillospiraceae bacterium]|nr:PqqD family protein [Candidatus Equicaccousia limihippi]